MRSRGWRRRERRDQLGPDRGLSGVVGCCGAVGVSSGGGGGGPGSWLGSTSESERPVPESASGRCRDFLAVTGAGGWPVDRIQSRSRFFRVRCPTRSALSEPAGRMACTQSLLWLHGRDGGFTAGADRTAEAAASVPWPPPSIRRPCRAGRGLHCAELLAGRQSPPTRRSSGFRPPLRWEAGSVSAWIWAFLARARAGTREPTSDVHMR